MRNERIVEYRIIQGSEDLNVVDFTMLEIQKGWQPFGAPFFDKENGFLVQAIVKYEDEEQEKVDNFEDSYRCLLESVEQLKKGIEFNISIITQEIGKKVRDEAMLSSYIPSLCLDSNIKLAVFRDILGTVESILGMQEKQRN